MAINSLNQGAISEASQLPFYDPQSGVDRRGPVSDLLALLQSSLTAAGGFITQYAGPNASGFGVTINPAEDGGSVFLLLTPAAGYAAGTITLPQQALCADGQELLVTCTQAVAALTVAGNGSTVNGAPTALAANGFFRLRFDGVFKAWFRVG